MIHIFLYLIYVVSLIYHIYNCMLYDFLCVLSPSTQLQVRSSGTM